VRGQHALCNGAHLDPANEITPSTVNLDLMEWGLMAILYWIFVCFFFGTGISHYFLLDSYNATATSSLTHIKHSFIKHGKRPIITNLKNMVNPNQSIILDQWLLSAFCYSHFLVTASRPLI